MRIEQLRLEERGQRVRAVARVVWEDNDRPTDDYYFEVDKQYADSISANPDAFLVACIMPALRYGERRIAVEGEICPYLKSGLETSMALIRHWYAKNGDRAPVTIEAKSRASEPLSKTSKRSAFFLTGGIDSLSTLRLNRLNYPSDHPASVRDGIIIFGLEVDDPTAFQHVVDLLSALAEQADFHLLPVYTNVRYLDDDWVFWADEFEAAVLSSVVHALSQRLSNAFIGSSFDYPALHPHGSHPLLDPNYSSYDLRIHHDSVALSRLEKTRVLADWDGALQFLRVCNRSEHYRSGVLNCGRCEKCLRTLTALLILDKLDQARAFAHREVTADLIRQNVYLSKTEFPFWQELIEPLRNKGRHDLVEALRHPMNAYRGQTGWKSSIKAFDRQYLRGSLYQMKRALTWMAPIDNPARNGIGASVVPWFYSALSPGEFVSGTVELALGLI